MHIAEISAAIFLLMAGSAPGAGQTTGPSDAGMFPMRKGTSWVYRGEVAWQTSGEGARLHRSRIDWTMEIIDSVERGRYKVAMILGHPRDLAWYEEGRKRGCDVLIAVDDKRYYRRECAPSSGQEKLVLPEGDLSVMTDEEHLILAMPLREGDMFGGDPERGINDGMYVWYVQAVRRARLGQIIGIPRAGPRTEYVLMYQTNPDHEIDTYVPGIGLTAYVYSHHGTVSEVNVKLVEFRTPGPK